MVMSMKGIELKNSEVEISQFDPRINTSRVKVTLCKTFPNLRNFQLYGKKPLCFRIKLYIALK